MIRLKLIMHIMLALPVAEEIQQHYVVAFSVLAYVAIVLLVLKIFNYKNHDFEN